jgi:HAMP domain-containing protein
MRRITTVLALAGIACGLVLLWVGSRRPRLVLVANPVLTPGVLNPDVTQATIARTICMPGWTRTIRPPSSYTSELKIEQMREYGVAGDPSGYQEDHLISLELGGHPIDPRNLWPEPNPRATEVDRIENELNRMVCSGEIALAEGQRRETELKHRSG